MSFQSSLSVNANLRAMVLDYNSVGSIVRIS